MTNFGTIFQALFSIPSHCSDGSKTVTSDDDYRDETSFSTSSSTVGQYIDDSMHERECQKMENEATRWDDFTSISGLVITTKSMGRSVPIACPSPSQDHFREKEFEEDLTTMYNESTWRMYHRIVDARRKQASKRKEAQQSFVNEDRDPIRSPTYGKVQRPQTYGNVPGMFCAQSLPIISHSHRGIESSSDAIPSEIQFFQLDY